MKLLEVNVARRELPRELSVPTALAIAAHAQTRSLQDQVLDSGLAALAAEAQTGGLKRKALPGQEDAAQSAAGIDAARGYLALARDIVRKHGGRIEVESQVGRGTTFRVTLPQTRTARAIGERSET